MPLYSYECKCGVEFDAVLTIENCDQPQKCKCGKTAKKIIVLGHGGIQRTGDSLPWIRSIAKVLTDGDDCPNPNINTVQDLRDYYKSHPEVVPVESHPAFPSSLGDIERPDTPEQINRKRRKTGQKLLRKARSVEIADQASV